MLARRTLRATLGPVVAIAVTAAAVGGCGSSSKDTGGDGGAKATNTPGAGAPAAGKAVLPVAANPIANTSSAPGLTITKALVENNVSPATGKDVSDHLEVALKNTSAKPLDQIEVYYKITDPTKSVSEAYYTKLAGFSIAPGMSRVAHFDNTGATDHYPVNKFSLYYVDKNELVVDVIASAPGVKQATFKVKKDSGGAEAGVE
ncbi:MAG: hypothetical protein ACR2LK_03290 [Solirubrobacteraceae bacterium]